MSSNILLPKKLKVKNVIVGDLAKLYAEASDSADLALCVIDRSVASL